MAIQSDGKILLACYMGSGSAVDEVVIRLTSSGAIDTTYAGGTGQRVIDFGGLDLPLRMVLDSSGRAVVAGMTDLGDATLFRLTTSGDLDTTFSTDGKMLVDFGGSADEGSGVAIDSAGGIIIGGTGGANDDLVVARILSDGTIDTTFGTSGFAYASFGPGADEGEDLAIDSTGKIVIGGTADGNLAMAVARFTADGTPDITFGTNGKVRIDFYGDNTYENAEAMTVQSDDKIIIAGQVGTDFAVARLNAITTTTKTRLYVQQDANYNVTSLTDDSGNVVERYRYDPYGGVTVLNTDWTTRTGGTNYDQRYLYEGERYDAETVLYHMNAREYDPALGRWVNQDPATYVDGMNLYGFVNDNPATDVDPYGLAAYKRGSDDPTFHDDAGAGTFGSESPTLKMRALRRMILMKPMSLSVPHALAHLKHYLDGSGSDYQIDLQSMIDDVPSAHQLYEQELQEAKDFAQTLPPGTYNITSGSASPGYDTKGESWDWFYAVGGYSAWGKGQVTVKCLSNGGRKYTLDFQYKFHDRYNWDAGKAVSILGVTVTDQFMGDFQRMGLAREFNMSGSVEKTVTWTEGGSSPNPPPNSGGGRGGRS